MDEEYSECVFDSAYATIHSYSEIMTHYEKCSTSLYKEWSLFEKFYMPDKRYHKLEFLFSYDLVIYDKKSNHKFTYKELKGKANALELYQFCKKNKLDDIITGKTTLFDIQGTFDENHTLLLLIDNLYTSSLSSEKNETIDIEEIISTHYAISKRIQNIEVYLKAQCFLKEIHCFN
jgi:hypothetical protein